MVPRQEAAFYVEGSSMQFNCLEDQLPVMKVAWHELDLLVAERGVHQMRTAARASPAAWLP